MSLQRDQKRQQQQIHNNAPSSSPLRRFFSNGVDANLED